MEKYFQWRWWLTNILSQIIALRCQWRLQLALQVQRFSNAKSVLIWIFFIVDVRIWERKLMLAKISLVLSWMCQNLKQVFFFLFVISFLDKGKPIQPLHSFRNACSQPLQTKVAHRLWHQIKDINGTDIFRTYSNLICLRGLRSDMYSSSGIQYLIHIKSICNT